MHIDETDNKASKALKGSFTNDPMRQEILTVFLIAMLDVLERYTLRINNKVKGRTVVSH